MSWFNRSGPAKLENTFYKIAKLRFLPIFDKIPKISENSQGTSLKALGLIFRILALYIYKGVLKNEKIQNLIMATHIILLQGI